MSFDPKTTREERQAERAATRSEDKPLDTPFPYERVYFDPFEFDITRGSPEPDTESE
jgi:hypothetical protein